MCSDLIREVRRCKTAAEERALIAKEAAAMRAEFRETVRGGTRRPRPRWVRRRRKTLTPRRARRRTFLRCVLARLRS